MTEHKHQFVEVAQDCRYYLDHELPKKECFGGCETLKAISQLNETNVIVLNEDIGCYLPHGLNFNYKRCSILAYRLNEDHYDSVIRIEQDDILKIVQFLVSDLMRQYNAQNEIQSSIIDLDDSSKSSDEIDNELQNISKKT